MNKQNELIIYQNKDKKIEVQLKEETIWFNLNQIADLFDVKKSCYIKTYKKYFLREN